jgi:serine/threonine-protein kinase HipA
MGALSYAPGHPEAQHLWHSLAGTDLDEIAREIRRTLSGHDAFVEDLLTLGGASSGVRPKIVLHGEDGDWIIKFRSSLDSEDSGALEYAFHRMAQAAGLDVPEARLFPSRKGRGFFGVRRFDRKDNRQVHMHTVSGLLHADHCAPSLDYESVMKATLHLTRHVQEAETQFRNAVFNVLSHNRDDHAKNFSFLMDEGGTWRVSPAYDLTFSSGHSGEHATLVMGEGCSPGLGHLLKLAAVAGIRKDRALAIVDHVADAVSRFRHRAEEAGVSKRCAGHTGKVLDGLLQKAVSRCNS